MEFQVENDPDPVDIQFLETQIRREASAATGLAEYGFPSDVVGTIPNVVSPHIDADGRPPRARVDHHQARRDSRQAVDRAAIELYAQCLAAAASLNRGVTELSLTARALARDLAETWGSDAAALLEEATWSAIGHLDMSMLCGGSLHEARRRVTVLRDWTIAALSHRDLGVGSPAGDFNLQSRPYR